MRQDTISKRLHPHVVALFALFVLFLCCALVPSAQARNTIRWYDDNGNLHTIELSDLGPYEQQIQEEKMRNERGMSAPEVGDGTVSPEAPPQSEQLDKNYEQIKAEREQRQQRERIQRQIRSTDKEIDAVNQEIKKVEQEITYKKNRLARLNNDQNRRIAYLNQLEKLRNQLNLLLQKRQSLQTKKETLRQQMPPAQPEPGL